MEGEQERGGKIEGIMRAEGISPQTAGTKTSDATTTSVAEEAGNALSAGDNRASSNRRSREDQSSSGVPSTESRVCSKKPLHHGC